MYTSADAQVSQASHISVQLHRLPVQTHKPRWALVQMHECRALLV